MARAYLRVWVDSGQEDSVRGELLDTKGVKAVDLTAGDQDLMVILEADSYEDIVQIVLGQVRVLKGVAKTITSLAVNGPETVFVLFSPLGRVLLPRQ